MTKLTKTNTGNWAKQTTITKGGKWSFVGNFGSLEAANEAAEIQRQKGRKVKVTEGELSNSQVKKLHERAVDKAVIDAAERGLRGDDLKAVASAIKPFPAGQAFWRVDSYVTNQRQVMCHASREECEAAGVVPGTMNG